MFQCHTCLCQRLRADVRPHDHSERTVTTPPTTHLFFFTYRIEGLPKTHTLTYRTSLRSVQVLLSCPLVTLSNRLATLSILSHVHSPSLRRPLHGACSLCTTASRTRLRGTTRRSSFWGTGHRTAQWTTFVFTPPTRLPIRLPPTTNIASPCATGCSKRR